VNHHPITIVALRMSDATYFSLDIAEFPKLHRSERTLGACDMLGAKMGDIDERAQ
jgi:hypothetical protein